MVGAASEPAPGRGMKEVRSKVHIAGVGLGKDIVTETQMRQAVPRRMRFDMEAFEKYCYTTACPGCKAKTRPEIGRRRGERM